MLVFIILEFKTSRSIVNNYEQIEGQLLDESEEDEEAVDKEMRENALKGIMEAMNNQPEIFEE